MYPYTPLSTLRKEKAAFNRSNLQDKSDSLSERFGLLIAIRE